MNLSVVPYDLRLDPPYHWAQGRQERRRGLLVRVDLDGVTGWGEVAPPPHDVPPTDALVRSARDAFVTGDEVEDVVQALDACAPSPRIRNGILGAWLDAFARRDGVGLADLLAKRYGRGVARRSVPVNALCGVADPAATARRAEAVRDAGFQTLKIKSDGDLAHDVARLRAVRDAVGTDLGLRLDANGSWPPEAALGHLEALAEFDLDYVEQPVGSAHGAALAGLVRRSPVPVALDESCTGVDAVQGFLDADARPWLILKPQRLGGADHVVAVLGLADAAGLGATVTNSLETAVGRGHALALASLLRDPVPCGLATERWLATDTHPTAARCRGAWMDLPDAPGLGFTPEVPT